MTRNHNQGPTLGTLLCKTFATGLGALRNRGELVLVELEQENSRLLNLILRGVLCLFLAMMAVLLLTGTVIFLVPEAYRLWAAAGFTVLYLLGTLWMALSLKGLLKRVPFSETVAQLRRDRELLEAFE